MMLLAKIMGLWVVGSFALALVVGPWLRHARKSQTTAAAVTPDPAARPDRFATRSRAHLRSVQ